MGAERVQTIASKALSSGTIPEEFIIRSETEQSAITTFPGPVPEIPTIDLGGLDERPDRKNAVVRAIADASREWGIFQVVNHGIPDEVIARLQAAGKEFFELPQEEKEVYAEPPDAKDIEGYGTKLQKHPDGKKAWVDHLFHRILPLSRVNYRFWPDKPLCYREANEEYAKHIKQLADKLMRYLSLGLGLEDHVIKEAVGGDDLEYLLKINYYPPCPRPDLTLGVVAHTDLSSLTVLVPNEVPGLQVFKDERWIDAKYIPNALIIHNGDQIEVLTNGKYKSVLHRTTVARAKARMSWPVFLEPPADLVVGPLSQFVDQNNPPKYKAKKFKNYAYCKLNKLPQ